MSILYRSNDGTEVPIAGTMTSGELIPSVSQYQSGTTSGSGTITLSNTMPDTDYVVVTNNGTTVSDKTKTSFAVSGACSWQAFKLMTDEVTSLDEAQIEANRTAITALQTDRLKRYALNAFDPSISEDHLGENYTIGHTSASNPPTSPGYWWEVVQFNAQHFAIQLWTNEAGYSYIRFRYVAGTGSTWTSYRRLDSDTQSQLLTPRIRCSRNGNVVTMHTITDGTGGADIEPGAWRHIGTVEAGMRPIETVGFPITLPLDIGYGIGFVDTDGIVMALISTNGGNHDFATFNATWII